MQSKMESMEAVGLRERENKSISIMAVIRMLTRIMARWTRRMKSINPGLYNGDED